MNRNRKSSISEKNGDDDEFVPLSVLVFITAKDNGTMLRAAQLNATLELLDEIGGKFELGTVGSFYKFCTHFCELNEPIRHFAVFWKKQSYIKNFKKLKQNVLIEVMYLKLYVLIEAMYLKL